MMHHTVSVYVTSSALAFLSSALLIYLIRLFSLRFEILDHVSERKIHQQPTSRLGGVAVFISTFSVFFFSQPFVREQTPFLWGCLASFVLGFYDDIKGLSSNIKLIFQILLSLLVCWAGFVIQDVRLFGFVWNLGLLSWPVTIFWFVACMNAINLIDGSDGLCAGVVSVSAACLLCLSSYLFLAVFLSTLIAFVVYNFPPASIFMGDGGSYFIGFVMAFYAISVSSNALGETDFLVAILFLALPFTDTFLTILRRFKAGIPIFSPDTGHIHHCLLRRGISKEKTMLLLVGAQGVFSLFACLIYWGNYWSVVLGIVGSLILFSFLVREVLFLSMAQPMKS
ncbi:MAG: undecaprenyl/decaprenyl-phosphate alpha-N-acetylglucosaminyl 1-phosphate transferase [Myxococcaceae bacterium]|nr:undecaprenyl/decaprenyl-phosphate alpha-N-acetylglucosaminyl 1-phosphate transferase [Myxococcaceae bacterium]MBH2006797.1 undecaprenyl/decaprenyl-phosphate alpha-N-acetylglucosaminyl 1-phosphate transferase [Myxococcaceae bacterium]